MIYSCGFNKGLHRLHKLQPNSVCHYSQLQKPSDRNVFINDVRAWRTVYLFTSNAFQNLKKERVLLLLCLVRTIVISNLNNLVNSLSVVNIKSNQIQPIVFQEKTKYCFTLRETGSDAYLILKLIKSAASLILLSDSYLAQWITVFQFVYNYAILWAGVYITGH